MLCSNYKVRFFIELDGQTIARDYMAPSLDFAKQAAQKNFDSGACARIEVMEYRGLSWFVVDTYQA